MRVCVCVRVCVCAQFSIVNALSFTHTHTSPSHPHIRIVQVAAEKFKVMVQYRVAQGIDDVRSRMEQGALRPPEFPGFKQHHVGYVHSTFDLCAGAGRGGEPISIECIPKFDFETLFAIDDQTQDDYIMHVMEWSFYRLDCAYLKTGRAIGYVKSQNAPRHPRPREAWHVHMLVRTAHTCTRMHSHMHTHYIRMHSLTHAHTRTHARTRQFSIWRDVH